MSFGPPGGVLVSTLSVEATEASRGTPESSLKAGTKT
jgi:hypothetical protein